MRTRMPRTIRPLVLCTLLALGWAAPAWSQSTSPAPGAAVLLAAPAAPAAHDHTGAASASPALAGSGAAGCPASGGCSCTGDMGGMGRHGHGMGGQGMGPGMGMGGMGMGRHGAMMGGMGMGRHGAMMGGQGMGMGRHGAMMGGEGMGPGMGFGRDKLAGLDLSDDQQSRVRKVHDDLRRRNWDTLGRMMDERAKLRDLHAAPAFDRDALASVHRRIGELRQQMIEARLDAHAAVEQVLTPEQRQRLRERWQSTGGGPAG